MSATLTALFLGDVIGQAGARAVFAHLKQIARRVSADVVVVNGENASDGFGLTDEIVTSIFEAGAAVITTGNHVWQRKELYPLLDSEPRLLRPGNYPSGAPGHGHCVVDVRGTPVAVASFQGRKRMPAIDCPFRRAADLVRSLERETRIVLIDFHAEATDEKEAFAHHLDGSVSAIVGTHTHVATNDARVLPRGTAFQTDLGACGPGDSVIGFAPEISIRRAMTQLPLRNEVSGNPVVLNGAVVTIDAESGHALSISSVREISTF
ncbi:MAG: TIGR00282 family metallophosphoesterase [Spirochaetota bacterium]